MIGAVLAERYRIDAALARGGMGAVYRGTDLRLQRSVAIKVLLPALAEDLDAIQRFQREGLATARLSHPGIVQILDVGTAPEPGGRGRISFIVMELVEGHSLASLIARGPLPVARVVEIGAQLCAALGAAHAAGITHRDLKPANVMLVETPEGERVKTVDFGLAQIKSGTVHTRLTQTGQILGTPLYMSPEQARAQPCDARTDVYAVGLILWSCLTGRVPYSGTDMASVVVSVLQEVPAPLDVVVPGVPRGLALAISRAIEKRPEERFESMHAFASALRGATTTTRSGLAPSASRSGRGWLWVIAIGGAVIGALGLLAVLAVGAIAGLGWASQAPERPAQPAIPRETIAQEPTVPSSSAEGDLEAARGERAEPESAERASPAPEPTRHRAAPHVTPTPRDAPPTAAPSPASASPESPPAHLAGPDEPASVGATPAQATPSGAASSAHLSQLCEIAARCCERIGAPYEACRERMVQESDLSCRNIIRGYRSAFEGQGRDPGPCREP